MRALHGTHEGVTRQKRQIHIIISNICRFIFRRVRMYLSLGTRQKGKKTNRTRSSLDSSIPCMLMGPQGSPAAWVTTGATDYFPLWNFNFIWSPLFPPFYTFYFEMHCVPVSCGSSLFFLNVFQFQTPRLGNTYLSHGSLSDPLQPLHKGSMTSFSHALITVYPLAPQN